VQDVVGEVLDALPTGAAVGLLSGVSIPGADAVAGGPAVGSKRKREEGELRLDDGAVAAALGAAALAHTPRRLRMSLNGANTTRALLHSAGVSATFLGKAAGTGALTIDPSDPLWAAHRSHLRAREARALAARKTTQLEEGTAATGVTSLASAVGDLASLTSGGGGGGGGEGDGWIMRKVLGAIGSGGFSASTSGSTGAMGSISELFEKAAYWSVADLVKKLGAKEVSCAASGGATHRAHIPASPPPTITITARAQSEVREEVRRTCDHIRSGPHHGKYRLKPEYRSVRSAPPEPNDGISADGT
jgi:hypothetical protein